VQILIDQPLRKAISECRTDDFKKLALVRGFDRVLVRVLESTASSESTDPIFVFNTALLLNDSDLDSAYQRGVAWRHLNTALRKTSAWKTIRPEDVKALAALQFHADPIDSFITAVASKLTTLDEAAFGKADVTESHLLGYREE